MFQRTLEVTTSFKVTSEDDESVSAVKTYSVLSVSVRRPH